MPQASPRVLLVMPDQWPRALLRAALRNEGYDALGAPSLAAALRYRREAPDRGPVRLVLVDRPALAEPGAAEMLGALDRRHAGPALVLLTTGGSSSPLPPPPPSVAWRRIVHRPATIAELVDAVRAVLPLPPDAARPLD